MNKDPDRMLEDYLEGRSAVSKAYRALGREQPPREVDREILAAARRSVSGKREKKAWRSTQWILPFSAVAVLTLSIALVLELESTPPRPSQTLPFSPTTESPMRLPAEQPGAMNVRDSQPPEPAKAKSGKPPETLAPTGRAHTGSRLDTATEESAGLATPAAVEASDTPHLTPEEWLAAINALREAGDIEQANEELRKFRSVYPRYLDEGQPTK